MIIFDYDKYIKDIKKNGIGATDIRANTKINDVLTDLIFNTTYKKGKIINKVKEIASDYYRGLPEKIIIDKLSESYDETKIKKYIYDNSEMFFGALKRTDIIQNCKITKSEYRKYRNDIEKYLEYQDIGKKVLTLYKSEMETINSLENDKLQRLAFALLVAFKYHSYHRVLGGEIKYYKTKVDFLSDAYALADFRKVSGTTRNKLLYELNKRGLVYYWKKDNETYKYQPLDSDRTRWIAFNNMSIPFCVEAKGTQDTEEVFMQMTNYDDIMLYLRYYQGDADVTTCECCGTPILKSGNAKRYCSDCADAMKKASDKARYDRKRAI